MIDPRVVQVADVEVMFGADGWSVDKNELFRLVSENPTATDELAEARVAYQTDVGEKHIVSADGWSVDFSGDSKDDVRASVKRMGDPRIKQLGLVVAIAEFHTSTSMSEASWLQPAIDLERVTGSTEQDYVFVAGINRLQQGGSDNELAHIAAITDILGSNPQDEYGGSYRLTRNIQGVGMNDRDHDFYINKWGPNIRPAEAFGLRKTDDLVVWTTARGDKGGRLYPLMQIVSVTETLPPTGEAEIVIPTYALGQLVSARSSTLGESS